MLFLGHGLLLALLGISLGAIAGVALATTISDLSLWVDRHLVWFCLILPCITSAACRPRYCGGM